MTEDATGLQQELKQNHPFASPSQEAALAVIRTADQLKRRFSEVLGQLGVSLQQYNVLRILRGAGAGGIPTLEIGDRMIEQAPGVTRMIDRLAERGWADRERCASDRRVVYCRITEAGLALLEAAEAPLAAAHEEVTRPLEGEEISQLVALLEKIRHGNPVPDCDGEMSGVA